MTKVMLAGHTFACNPSYSRSNGERLITINIPLDTERSVLNDLQDAELIEITDPLGREVVGSHRLVGWRSIETIRLKNELQYLVSWAIPNPDETEKLMKQVEDLTEENEELTEVILELAGYIGELRQEETGT